MSLPRELQHLQNLIEGAKTNDCEALLRNIIKSAADKAPAADVIRIAQTILDCGIQFELSKRADLN